MSCLIGVIIGFVAIGGSLLSRRASTKGASESEAGWDDTNHSSSLEQGDGGDGRMRKSWRARDVALCAGVVGAILLGGGFLAYLKLTADRSDCPRFAGILDDLDRKRMAALSLADQPSADRCAVYRDLVDALARTRSANVRRVGLFEPTGVTGMLRQDKEPNNLQIEEDFYRRVIARDCPAP